MGEQAAEWIAEKGKEVADAAPGAASEVKAPLVSRPIMLFSQRAPERERGTLTHLRCQAAKWAAANPGTAACAGAGTVGVVLVAVPMAAAAPVLGVAGFSSGGVVGGKSTCSIALKTPPPPISHYLFARCAMLAFSANVTRSLSRFDRRWRAGWDWQRRSW